MAEPSSPPASLSVEQKNEAAFGRLSQANAHRPKLWMCPDCHVRCRVENARSHANSCHALQQASKTAPVDKGWEDVDGENADYVNRVTAVVREADRAFEKVGGGSRHWVRDCFLPLLNRAGLFIGPQSDHQEQARAEIEKGSCFYCGQKGNHGQSCYKRFTMPERLRNWADEIEACCGEFTHAGINDVIQAMRSCADDLTDNPPLAESSLTVALAAREQEGE